MNYNTDDLLFGAMYHLATYHPNYFKLYLSKKKLSSNREAIYKFCDLDAKKLKRHLDKLIEKKLIKEEELDINGVKIPVYTFPYDKEGKYRLIDNDMLWYLVSTRNKQAIRVYLYLFNGFLWKEQLDDYFIFTNNSILKALGYASKSRLASSGITNILESFKREGVIDYCVIYIEGVNERGKTFPIPQMKLTFIAKEKNELKNRTF